MPTEVWVKGFVVGQGQPVYFADGTTSTRPRLLECELRNGALEVLVGRDSVTLDREAAEAARNLLNDALEAMS